MMMLDVLLSVRKKTAGQVFILCVFLTMIVPTVTRAQTSGLTSRQFKSAPQAWWDAAMSGDVATLKRLQQRGQYLEARNNSGASALLIAVNLNLTQEINWLLKHKASLKVQAYSGYNVLIAACTQSNSRLVKLALEAGVPADSNYQHGDIRSSAAHEAAANGDLASMRLLVEHGVNLKWTNHNHQTPLGWALVYGQIPMYRYLLSQGLKLAEHQSTGEHLIVYALWHNQPQIMRELSVLEVEPWQASYTQRMLKTSLDRGYLTCAQVVLEVGRWKQQRPEDQAEAQLIEAIIKGNPSSVEQLARQSAGSWSMDFLPIALRFANLRGQPDIPVVLEQAGKQAVEKFKYNKALKRALLKAVDDEDFTRVQACFYAGVKLNDTAYAKKILSKLYLNSARLDLLGMLVEHGFRFDVDPQQAADYFDSVVRQKHTDYALMMLDHGCVPFADSLVTAIVAQDQTVVRALLKFDWDWSRIPLTYRGKPINLLTFAGDKGTPQIHDLIKQALAKHHAQP